MGPAETKYRQWMESLHPLSPKQEADAEVVFALAAAVDAVRVLGTGLSSLAGNARALAVHVREFRERVGAPPPTLVKETAPSNVDSADEVARKRATRRATQGRQTG
jgi:hypothetical protein